MVLNRDSWVDQVLSGITVQAPMVWGSTFATLDAPTGLVATYDPVTSTVTLTWDASAIPVEVFYQWIVERQIEDGPMVRIDDDSWSISLTDPDAPTFTDYDAPQGRTIFYRVRIWNGAEGMESEPGEVTIVTPATGYFLCLPGDDARCWQLLWPRGGLSRVQPKRQTIKQPIGRTTWMATTGPTLRPRGSLTVGINPEDIDDLYRLREVSEMVPLEVPYAILKSDRGESDRVVLGDLNEATEADGTITVGLDWWVTRAPPGEG